MPFVLAQPAGLNSMDFPRWATDRRLRPPGRYVKHLQRIEHEKFSGGGRRYLS
jgi:hypothetical protein